MTVSEDRISKIEKRLAEAERNIRVHEYEFELHLRAIEEIRERLCALENKAFPGIKDGINEVRRVIGRSKGPGFNSLDFRNAPKVRDKKK